MQGILLIERENSDGDRRILKSFDGEDSGALDAAVSFARAAFAEANALRVRVVLDRPERDPQLRLLFKIDEWGRERSWPL